PLPSPLVMVCTPSRVGDVEHHQHAMTASGLRLSAEPSAHYHPKIKAEIQRIHSEFPGPTPIPTLKDLLFFPGHWSHYWCPRIKIWQDARSFVDTDQIQIRHVLSVYWKWKFHPLFPLGGWH